ncbi:hypothetical protein [Nonomuraea dietziae]|uniref:hypothetical protein n=1 Tax=Nonomuraea dietziae TaxID=65515 RepID=UPI00342A1078
MNGSGIAAATPRKAYEGKIVLDGIGFRNTMRGPLARYDVMLGSLVAIGIIIGLVPVGKKGPGVRPLGRVSSRDQVVVRVRCLTQIIEARRWRPAR